MVVDPHVCPVCVDRVLECVIGLLYVSSLFQHLVYDLSRCLQIGYGRYCSRSTADTPESSRSFVVPSQVVLLLYLEKIVTGREHGPSTTLVPGIEYWMVVEHEVPSLFHGIVYQLRIPS